jgi:hypothetical protein
MNETIEAKDQDQELRLQRELAYRRSLETDEWALTFFSEIQQDLDPSDSLRRHIFETAADLQAELTKECEWADYPDPAYLDPASSPLTNLSSALFNSSPVRRTLKPLSPETRLQKAIKEVINGKSVRASARLYGVNRNTIKNRMKGLLPKSHAASNKHEKKNIMIFLFSFQTFLRFIFRNFSFADSTSTSKQANFPSSLHHSSQPLSSHIYLKTLPR